MAYLETQALLTTFFLYLLAAVLYIGHTAGRPRGWPDTAAWRPSPGWRST